MKARAYALALTLLFVGTLGAQSSIAGRVDRIIDGDTIVVDGVGPVRLIGVDAAEPGDARPQVAQAGRQSAAFAAGMALGKTVRLEFQGAEKDKFGRTLAYAYLPDGTCLNAELIRQGYAHAYTTYPFSKLEEFRALERQARAQSRGLWAVDVERAANTPSIAAASPSAAAAAATATSASNAKETVYATRTGAKYHRTGCRSLARSQIPLALEEATKRYGPCSICKPPVLQMADAPPSTATAAPTRAAPTGPATAGRCQATTRKGTQCSRNAQPGRSYCWQH